MKIRWDREGMVLTNCKLVTNILGVELFWENIKLYLHFSSFFNTERDNVSNLNMRATIEGLMNLQELY